MCLIHRWQSGVCGERDVCVGAGRKLYHHNEREGRVVGSDLLTYSLDGSWSLSDSRRPSLQSSCSIMAQKGLTLTCTSFSLFCFLFFAQQFPLIVLAAGHWPTMNRFMTCTMPTRPNVFSLNSYYSNTLALAECSLIFVCYNRHMMIANCWGTASRLFLSFRLFLRTSVDRCIKSSCDVGCHDDRWHTRAFLR
jgi:hypothetical protein